VKRSHIPEHVIGVGTSASAVERPHEGVLVLGRVPEGVEYGGVPLNLKGHLGHADGVAGRAGGGVGEALAGDGVVHVRLMVRTVEALAVPASVILSAKLLRRRW